MIISFPHLIYVSALPREIRKCNFVAFCVSQQLLFHSNVNKHTFIRNKKKFTQTMQISTVNVRNKLAGFSSTRRQQCQHYAATVSSRLQSVSDHDKIQWWYDTLRKYLVVYLLLTLLKGEQRNFKRNTRKLTIIILCVKHVSDIDCQVTNAID